jgi:hypothetical protein
MNFDITNFQTLAANLPVEGEVCDLTHAEVSTQTEINAEIVTLIQQVAATSIAEIDRLVTELQEVKSQLQSKGQRVEREMVRYTKLTQMASFTAKIILDTISQWHPAGNPQNPGASEVMVASTENSMGAFEKSHYHDQQDTYELGEDADATKRSAPYADAGLASPSLCDRARASDRGQPEPDEAC